MTTTTTTTITRDSYNAIYMHTLTEDIRNQVRQLVQDVQSADKIDEHGGWEFGIQRLGRRTRALNWDLYGFGHDPNTNQFLAVIQVREWTEGRRWNTVRKSYFLLGYNEDGSAFAHPVSANVVHTAIRRHNGDPQAVIDAAQNWIFGGDYRNMLRQGDIAIVPLKRRPAGTKGQRRRMAILEGSHEIRANIIAEVDGKLYAKHPTLIHTPGTHPTVEGHGWYRIVVGRRARFWDFATPTID